MVMHRLFLLAGLATIALLWFPTALKAVDITGEVPASTNPTSTCQDSSANNFGQSLPCTYTTQPTLLCQDSSADNVGEALPCTYSKTPVVLPTTVTGYVYQTTSIGQVRLSGATVTLEVLTNGVWNLATSTVAGELNPQVTDSLGQFSFSVAPGTYRLMVELSGYNPYQSDQFSIQTSSLVRDVKLTPVAVITQTLQIPPTVLAIFAALPGTQSVRMVIGALTALALATMFLLPLVSNLPLLNLLGSAYAWILAFFMPPNKSSWGQVIDAETGQPVAAALVRILALETGRVLDTQTTNVDGRFGFLVEPGTYHIEVMKQHYQFPSKLASDGYHGETVQVLKEQVLELMIPLDPELALVSHRLRLISQFESLARLLNVPVLILGLILSALIVFGQPTVLNLAVLVLYGFAALYTFAQWLRHGHRAGLVIDDHTTSKLNLAILRLFDTVTGKLLASKVTNDKGEYFLWTHPGTYKVSIVKPGYERLVKPDVRVNQETTIADQFRLHPITPMASPVATT